MPRSCRVYACGTASLAAADERRLAAKRPVFRPAPSQSTRCAPSRAASRFEVSWHAPRALARWSTPRPTRFAVPTPCVLPAEPSEACHPCRCICGKLLPFAKFLTFSVFLKTQFVVKNSRKSGPLRCALGCGICRRT